MRVVFVKPMILIAASKWNYLMTLYTSQSHSLNLPISFSTNDIGWCIKRCLDWHYSASIAYRREQSVSRPGSAELQPRQTALHWISRNIYHRKNIIIISSCSNSPSHSCLRHHIGHTARAVTSTLCALLYRFTFCSSALSNCCIPWRAARREFDEIR